MYKNEEREKIYSAEVKFIEFFFFQQTTFQSLTQFLFKLVGKTFQTGSVVGKSAVIALQ